MVHFSNAKMSVQIQHKIK